MKRKLFIFLILNLCMIWIEPCPSSCRCSVMTTTICKGKKLHKVPIGIPEYTMRLVLSESSISSIRTHDFEESLNLRMLVVADTPLTFFDTEVIKKFKNLVVLNLKRNQLRKISKFPSHLNLKPLELQSNLLTDIDGPTFSSLRNISISNLMNNRLSDIPVDLFKPLENLTRYWVWKIILFVHLKLEYSRD